MMHELHFRCMDTEVGFWLWSRAPEAPLALEAGRRTFQACEAELSRFDPRSGLSQLNRRAGQGFQPVSPLLFELVQLALEQAGHTEGLFDPTVLGAMGRAGYPSPGSFAERPDYRRVQLGDGTVRLPAGLGLDLGGIAKGWTVDRVACDLSRWGPALVDAGGDLRALGLAWPIAVQDPFHPERDLFRLDLRDRAAATSSVGKRGRHLIDPRTGRPAETDVHTSVVLAETAVKAEVAAKVSLVLGQREGRAHLDRNRLKGWLLAS